MQCVLLMRWIGLSLLKKGKTEAAEMLGVLINLEKAKKTASSIEKNQICSRLYL